MNMQTDTGDTGDTGDAGDTRDKYAADPMADYPVELTHAELARLQAAGRGFNLQNLFANAQAYLDRGGPIFYPGQGDHISHPQSENRGG